MTFKLSNSISVTLILLTSLMISCGDSGGGGVNAPASPYDGIWYETTKDNYLEIKSNQVSYRVCSLNDGYREYLKGTIEDNKFVVSNIVTGIFSRSEDKLTFSNPDKTAILITLNYSKVASIPVACTGDAVEITRVTPTSAVEGIQTTFIVDFDYRLTSTNSAIVHLGFNDSNIAEFLLSTSTFTITQSGISSGSLTADSIPVLYTAPETFSAYVNISNNPHPEQWMPLSTHTSSVTVTKPALLISETAIIDIKNKQTSTNTGCTLNTIVPCSVK